MYKEILRTIAGVEVYPVVSLLLFVLVFASMLVWVTRLDRKRLSGFAALPLDPPLPARSRADDDCDSTKDSAHDPSV
jgi:hypothetical protein